MTRITIFINLKSSIYVVPIISSIPSMKRFLVTFQVNAYIKAYGFTRRNNFYLVDDIKIVRYLIQEE